MKDKLLPIIIYLAGMLSFFMVDFIIARYETPESIANWAVIKSVVMIGGTLVLFGMDQVMVRLPCQAFSILKRSVWQILLGIIAYTILIYYLNLLVEGLLLTIAVFCLALSTLFFGYFRSQFELLLAQIITNVWKILFLMFLGVSIFLNLERNYSLLFIASISIVVLSVLPLIKKTSNKFDENIESESVVSQLGLGGRFFISLMTLNLSLYLEQVLLNMENHTVASSIYFSHFAIILPLMMLFNGFLGFILGPFIRKDIRRFDLLLGKYWWGIIIMSFSLAAISYIAAKYAYGYLLHNGTEFTVSLALIVVGIGILRIIYILPSSYLGVVASKEELTQFVRVNVIGIFVLIVAYFLLYYFTQSALYSVALASLLNWFIRTVYGNYLVWKIWKARLYGGLLDASA